MKKRDALLFGFSSFEVLKPKTAFFAFALLLLSSYSLAQSVEWLHTYSIDTVYDVPIGIYSLGLDVIPTSDGGLLAVGIEVYPNALNYYHPRALKTDSEGVVEWSNIYNYDPQFPQGWEEAHGVVETPDGGFLLAGAIGGPFFTEREAMVMKISAAGDSLWARHYSFGEDNLIRVIRNDPSGGYITAGQVSNHLGPTQMFVLKLNDQGDSTWSNVLFPGENSVAYDLELAPDADGFVVVGTSEKDLLIFEINQTGQMEWSQTHDFAGRDIGFSIRRDTDSGFIVGGTQVEADTAYPIVLKVDDLGNEIWHTTMDILGGSITTVTPVEDGYWVSGSLSDLFNFYNLADGFLVKMDKSGNIVSKLTLNQLEEMEAGDHEMLSDGSIIATGTSREGLFLLKTGEISSTKDPRSFETLIRVFPQPASETVTFGWKEPPPVTWTFELWDTKGRSWFSREISGSEFAFSRRGLSAGWYVYRIKSGQNVQTGKVVFQ